MRPTLFIALLALAAPAFGDEAADAKKAKELFAAGQKLYKADKYTDAIAKFEAAYALKPHPVIYFNIARCYEQLGDAPRAIKAYKDYLRLSPEAKDKDAVNETLAALERKVRERGLTRITVLADPSGAKVEVDGKAVPGNPASAELPAGAHKVVVSLDGYEKAERAVTTAAGQTVDLSVTLRKPTELKTPAAADAPTKEEPAPTASLTPAPGPAGTVTQPAGAEAPRKRIATWVVGGVAVAGLGAGITMGLMSSSATAAMRAPVTSGPYPTTAQRDAQVQNITTLAVGADVAYGVAAAAAITAVVLFFVEK